jgi:hypothetical protein
VQLRDFYLNVCSTEEEEESKETHVVTLKDLSRLVDMPLSDPERA